MKTLTLMRALARRKHDNGEMGYLELQLILRELENRKSEVKKLAKSGIQTWQVMGYYPTEKQHV